MTWWRSDPAEQAKLRLQPSLDCVLRSAGWTELSPAQEAGVIAERLEADREDARQNRRIAQWRHKATRRWQDDLWRKVMRSDAGGFPPAQ